MTPSELRARVAASYERLGLPSWPDPHAEPGSPRDEEYSRVTEPGRYAVVHARARVWAERLAELPGIEVETLPPGRSGRGVRITSARPGTLPLFLLERDVPLALREGTLPVLHVSAGRPEIEVAMLPDCGCDACDWGSADLLETADDKIWAVVGGPFVALRGGGWDVRWWAGGGSSKGGDHRGLMDLCRRLADGADVRLPHGVEVFVGRSWLE